MIYHVLPGDSLTETFRQTRINGEVIVFRESFVTGDLDAKSLDQLWEIRSNFVSIEYGGDPIEYQDKVAGELEKLRDVASEDEVNLWFEYELFCSVNMWFCLDQLKDSGARIFRVAPVNTTPDNVWEGFGTSTADELLTCFDSRIQLSQADIAVGARLWSAYRDHDIGALRELSEYRSPCLPFLREVCDAAAEIEQKPLEIVTTLRSEGFNEIETLFPEFRKRAGVYGFGDSQVESLMNRL
jgi:hypothetical protein